MLVIVFYTCNRRYPSNQPFPILHFRVSWKPMDLFFDITFLQIEYTQDMVSDRIADPLYAHVHRLY